MMNEKMDMGVLQQLVYYVNNAKMNGTQRDEVNKAIIDGIITGSIETDGIFRTKQGSTQYSVCQFLIDYLQSKPAGKIQATELYGQYQKWCASHDTVIVSAAKFGVYIIELGINRQKSSDANYYF